MIEIIKAEIEQIPYIIDLAFNTWFITYEPIVGKDQTDFMFGEIYTPDSLLKQMEFFKHSFYILYVDKIPKGFASFSERPENKEVYKLHKLYVLPTEQGKSYGKLLLQHCEVEVKKLTGNYLELNVNRYNKSKEFYEHLGYSIIREEDIAIGNYFMNDFVLQKKLF